MILLSSQSLPEVKHSALIPTWVTVPQIVNKTKGDRIITSLTVYQDEIYIGYGDWNANNGPTDVLSVNPDTGEITTHLENVSTEAINCYREFNGWLYGAWVDQSRYYGPGGYSTNEGGTWHSVEVPDMVHTFDVFVGSFGTLVCGSRINETNSDIDNAVVMFKPSSSSDWQRVLQYGDASASTRFYSFQNISDAVLVSCSTPQGVKSFKSTDGLTWQETTTVIAVDGFSPTCVYRGYEYTGTDQGTIVRRKVQ